MTNGGYEMEELQEIKEWKRDVDKRIGRIESDLPVIRERYENMGKLLQSNNDVLTKLNDTMMATQLTMESMKSSIELTNVKMEEMKKDFSVTADEVKSIRKDMEFNVVVWLKKNFVTIALLVAVGGYFVSSVLQ